MCKDNPSSTLSLKTDRPIKKNEEGKFVFVKSCLLTPASTAIGLQRLPNSISISSIPSFISEAIPRYT
ncbi:hypothetical protein L2E82_14553 [Cichorium intybus]|uniref:Uncharacterized protein n=1 Tax=Cichorium intybus TaxID=13427 RepID=A0ACB9F0D2_CICIN|nr:hypothetical protein L2E82_14553 [Cichorium intybus]